MVQIPVVEVKEAKAVVLEALKSIEAIMHRSL
jgi:hypothetical protein